MKLTDQQMNSQRQFRDFVMMEIIPNAEKIDREEYTPPEVIQKMGEAGYLGAIVPKSFGGQQMDLITYGLLNEEIGRGCSSIRSLLTVHSMICYALLRWGTDEQKQKWLPQLATGEKIAAFGLSEPNIGSDAKNVETTAILDGDHYILNGQKKWITYGQTADLFIIFTKLGGSPTAFLIERDTPGFTTKPINGIYGTRGSMLAELHLKGCRIPKGNLLGSIGFGFTAIANTCLDLGRYSVAWGSVGIGQACLDACIDYTTERVQFGKPLKEHQLIQQMLTEMITNVKAARLLCLQAGYLRENSDPRGITDTSIAKYFASRMAVRVANDAVQIYGANGCSMDYPVQRYLRDSKILEIIEGSTQIQQTVIAQYGYSQGL